MIKELQRFLGFTNFYWRFIIGFSLVAALHTIWYGGVEDISGGHYDIGDKELLAMKAAFEEWHHWLEGAKHPFTVLTNHKNLEYLKSAK